ncbi:MAG: hypothetical protein WB392_03490 [Methanotrichaceae archaeon]
MGNLMVYAPNIVTPIQSNTIVNSVDNQNITLVAIVAIFALALCVLSSINIA